MSQQIVNLGAIANDGTGSPLRTGGQDINANFTELYGTASSIFSVTNYGAVGDGVTDDTAAFVAALAAAAAQVGYYGTSLIATPVVVVPSIASASGHTKSYVISSTLDLPFGVRLCGLGTYGGILKWTGTTSTLFTVFGTAEAQPANLILEHLYCYNAGTAGTSIGLRARNFSNLRLRDCVFSSFRVGVWADWGQDFHCTNTQMSLCTRGAQLGGNLSQSETPSVPAGIRSGSNPWFDNTSFTDCGFSQNQIDVNHLGSTLAHGVARFRSCTFFESSTSPVASKTQFIRTTNLKGLSVSSCWFESGANGRTAVLQSGTDYDGNTGAVNLGGVVRENHILLTGGSSVIGVDIESGSASVRDNVIEINSGGTHIKLADASNSSTVSGNSYLNYPDSVVAGRLTTTGVHELLGAAGSAGQQAITVGKVTVDDPSVSQVQFNLAGSRQAGMSAIAVDTIRFYNSAGTVRQQLLLGGGINGARSLADGLVLTSLGSAASFTIDASTGAYFTATATGATTTFNAPTNGYAGQRITITVIQDSTGGRAVTWNAVFKISWLDTGNTANRRSTVSFIFDGTNWNQAGAQTTYV